MINNYVWLVVNVGMLKDDVVSIWTTEELAKAGLIYHASNRPGQTYQVKKWQLNVTIPQWN